VTVSEQQAEKWLPVPGAGYYEASDRGHVRSVDRTIGGRFYKGVVLKPREDADGYLRVNITNDRGERQHNESVARLVLMAHDPEGYRPGLHACHGPNGKRDNRLTELRWDTPEANRMEALAVRLENSPPKPKPPKVCPRCGAEHAEKGKNCRACFEGIGVEFARLLVDGVPPEEAADRVGYPLNGALNLALRYGGLRFVTEAGLNVMLRGASHAEKPRRWRNAMKWSHR